MKYLLDVVGRDLLERSGIWKKDSKAPAILYRPLAFVSSNKQGIEFRLIGASSVAMAKTIRYGEPSPRIWKGNEHHMVVEGGVDMLSAVALGSKRTIIGLPGAKNWSEEDEWLHGLKGKHVLTATDADEAGDRGAKDLAKFLDPKVTPMRRHAHHDGCKDLNDELQQQLGL